MNQVLIGSLLGDGGVYPSRRGNSYFVEGHSLNQSDYLKWKAGILIPYFGGKVVTRNYDYKSTYFQSHVHPVFTELRKLWYPNGKKVLPEGELQKLDALGLTVWYMDDGSYDYQNHCCTLSIRGFQGQELVIQRWFKERWGINPHIITSCSRLTFSVKDSDKLLCSVAEHIHPSMIYKLGHLNLNNQVMIDAARRRRREYLQKNRDKIRSRHREYMRKYRARRRALSKN